MKLRGLYEYVYFKNILIFFKGRVKDIIKYLNFEFKLFGIFFYYM